MAVKTKRDFPEFASFVAVFVYLDAVSWDVDMLEEFAYVWTQGVVLDILPATAKYVLWSEALCGLRVVRIRVPTPPGKSWIFFLENSRTWKVLENHFGPGKSWKLKLTVLESPGKMSLKVMHFSSGSNGKQAAIV